MKTVKLTTRNINKAIKSLRRSVIAKPVTTSGFYVPTHEPKLSTRYKGKGRPRKVDYDWIEIDWSILKEFISKN